MINILLKVNYEGIILDVLWCDPAYLLFVPDSPIRDYFHVESQLEIDQAVQNACSTPISMFPIQLKLKNTSILRIVFTRFEKNVFLFGYQTEVSNNIQENIFLKIVQRFLDALKIAERGSDYFDVKAQTLNFEKIQMLNSDLVNMQRKLEKVNAQLNTANQLLSNRLVKDELTGLISRYQYRQEIDLLIREFPSECGIFAFLDIDHFKKVNDTYGHVIGDRYLVEFARRLTSISHAKIIFIRISGDEFGLFWQGIPHERVDEAIIELWQQITSHVLNKPVEIDKKLIPLGASVGMAVYNMDTTNVYDLIDFADFAMYLAKKAGKNQYARFDMGIYKHEKDLES